MSGRPRLRRRRTAVPDCGTSINSATPGPKGVSMHCGNGGQCRKFLQSAAKANASIGSSPPTPVRRGPVANVRSALQSGPPVAGRRHAFTADRWAATVNFSDSRPRKSPFETLGRQPSRPLPDRHRGREIRSQPVAGRAGGACLGLSYSICEVNEKARHKGGLVVRHWRLLLAPARGG